MHCPKCGHRQNSDEIRFCSKCGFDLKGVKELLAPEKYRMKAKENKARVTGFRHGAGVIIFGFMLTCVLYILSQLGVVPGSYSKIAFMTFLTLGMARALIPIVFGEVKSPRKSEDFAAVDEQDQTQLTGNEFSNKSLPEAKYYPPADFAAKKYTTNELVPILSVTEHTTRHLEKEIK